MDDDAADLYDSGHFEGKPQFYLHNNAASLDEVRAPNGDEIYPGYGDDSGEICAQLRRWHVKERARVRKETLDEVEREIGDGDDDGLLTAGWIRRRFKRLREKG